MRSLLFYFLFLICWHFGYSQNISIDSLSYDDPFYNHSLDSIVEQNTQKIDSTKNSSFNTTFWKKSRSLARTVVAAPFEYAIQPTFDFLISPFIPPIDYIFQENVIDKGIDLVTFGTQKHIMVYPTMDFNESATSAFGLTYEHKFLMTETEDRLTLSFDKMLNNDYDINTSYSWTLIPQIQLSSAFKASFVNLKSNAVYVKKSNQLIVFRDSSSQYNWALTWPWSSTLASGISMGISQNQFESNTPEQLSTHEIELQNRGLFNSFYSYPIGVSLDFNDKESPYAATKGAKYNLNVSRQFVEQFGDFYQLGLNGQNYFLLGKKFEVSRQEHRDNLRYLQHFNFDKAADLLNPEGMKERFLERKVLVSYWSFKQIWKAENQDIAFIGSQRLGRSSPLRAYPNGRFVDNASFNWTLEYRWPLLTQVDGLFFNEYGTVFNDAIDVLRQKEDAPQWYNSWGFGFRVRNPNLFILRASLAFHGASVPRILLTIRPEF